MRGLNQRYFIRELRKVLKPEYAELLQYPNRRRAWIDEAEKRIFETGQHYIEVPAYMTKRGTPEIVFTSLY